MAGRIDYEKLIPIGSLWVCDDVFLLITGHECRDPDTVRLAWFDARRQFTDQLMYAANITSHYKKVA